MIGLKILLTSGLLYVLAIIIKASILTNDKEYMQQLRNNTYCEYLISEPIDRLLAILATFACSVKNSDSIVFKGKFIITPYYKNEYEFKIVYTKDNDSDKITCIQLIDNDLVIIKIDFLKFSNSKELFDSLNVQNNQLNSLITLIKRLKKSDRIMVFKKEGKI